MLSALLPVIPIESHLEQSVRTIMENAPAGSSKKSTIYVGNFAPEVNEQQLLDTFVTFG
jgi:RNA recognition motif-containing protein